MTLSLNDRVGRIATEHPLAARVFHRHGIDFCCGGGTSLQDACRRRGVDAPAVLLEIEETLRRSTPSSEAKLRRWDQEDPAELIDHILTEYHVPLYEELPRIEMLCDKVVGVHGEKDARLASLQREFAALKADLLQHMAKEEQILFPMIQQGQGAMAEGPISVMRDEHEIAGAALERFRELTDNYRVPEAACNSWRALWAGLESLEVELHDHIHLENNILFPATLGRVG